MEKRSSAFQLDLYDGGRVMVNFVAKKRPIELSDFIKRNGYFDIWSVVHSENCVKYVYHYYTNEPIPKERIVDSKQFEMVEHTTEIGDADSFMNRMTACKLYMVLEKFGADEVDYDDIEYLKSLPEFSDCVFINGNKWKLGDTWFCFAPWAWNDKPYRKYLFDTFRY